MDAPGAGGGVSPSLDPQKKASVQAALVSAGWELLADRVRDCGRTAGKMHCRECGAEWIATDRYHHRICPDCAQIRAGRLFKAHERLTTGRPNLKHLVLTLKNEPVLSSKYLDWVINSG